MKTATNSGAIETLVHQGKTVVSSEDSALIEWAIRAIAEGTTATLESAFVLLRRERMEGRK